MEQKKYNDSISIEIEEKMKLSEMQKSERVFLQGLIKEYKPQKIVEIGVAAGASSAIILDAIKDTDSKLYSLDYSTNYYRNESLKTGFMVDEFEGLKQNWELKTGSMSCNFLDEIGEGIDFCLLDTMHSAPGEFLDYLQVLPFMKKGGIIVLHDISLHTFSGYDFNNVCCALFSIMKGQKIVPVETEHAYHPNIGAVVLDENVYENAFDVFYALFLPWMYELEKKDYNDLNKFFKKYYSKELVSIFENAYKYNKQKGQIKPQTQKHRSFVKKLSLSKHFFN